MESIGYVAKINSMYVREVFQYSDEVILTSNKFIAKQLERSDIEWLKKNLNARILKVHLFYEEIGIEQ